MVLVEILLLGKLCLVDNQSQWRNKVDIFPQKINEISIRIHTLQWLPIIKIYVNIPHDRAQKNRDNIMGQ